jgi:hypothetical protein
MFLVSEDCNLDKWYTSGCTILETVELEYGVTNNGSNARLSINGDIWLPTEHCGGSY